ncbi:MAG TPA: ferrochelatase [Anaerolineales bacterium]|nr:ferrochelatase [Anaerolineales bacterium]
MHLPSPPPLSGVILTNTGSPAAPTPEALRPYLRQFLSDRRVVDYPRGLWALILHGIILRTRPRRSARLYANIWTPEGSPLVSLVQRQAEGVRARLGAQWAAPVQVEIGMRYGEPSIARGLRQLRDTGATRFIIFPLFPQFTGATTLSTFDAVQEELATWESLPEVRTIDNYHDHPAYLRALAASIRETWAEKGRPDRLLFSFHGIPERYRRNGDPYREQCEATARGIASELHLPADAWQIAFQSRFGPEPWLKPYTDQTLTAWGREGIRTAHVLCPGFSADCLETVDEIGREGRHTFLEAGGQGFHYIPALNDRPDHLDALTEILVAHLEGALIHPANT